MTCVACLPIADGIELDRAAQRVLWHGLWIELPPLQYAGLQYLAERQGTPVPASELAATLWPDGAPHPRRNAQTLVRRLRAKLERNPAHPNVILAVVGEGYLIPA